METRPGDKKPIGSPIKNEVDPIPDTAKNISKAIFRDAEKRIKRPSNA